MKSLFHCSILRDLLKKRYGKRPYIWGCSSVGRAPALQAGGHGFESHHLHTHKGRQRGKEPARYWIVAQVVRAHA